MNSQQNQTQCPEEDLLTAPELIYGKASLEGYQTQNWTNSIRIFQELEDQGFSEASVALAQLESSRDLHAARAHAKKAAELDNVEGYWSLATLLAPLRTSYRDEVFDVWLRYCQQAAQRGCRDAMYELGNYYAAEKEYGTAYYWYQFSAMCGFTPGLPSAIETVKQWKQAGQPDLFADNNLHKVQYNRNVQLIMELLVDGSRPTPEWLSHCHELAFSTTDPFLSLYLGEHYAKLPDKAIQYYRHAHDLYCPIGIKRYADLITQGYGNDPDAPTAETLYSQAAVCGEPTACYEMAQLSKPNRYLTAFWYSKAYRHGHIPALVEILRL